MGYEAFLQAITDPKHPDHDDMLDWIGGSFDPEAFSVDDVNRVLSQSWPKKLRDLLKKAGSGTRKPSTAKAAGTRKKTSTKKATTGKKTK
jgi:hypothetical protein